jgi:hypothetical protein
MTDAIVMRCFYVLVHGRLNWDPALPAPREPDESRPVGFYCHRYVLASDDDEAVEKAFRRVRKNLDGQTGWLTRRVVELGLEAEEITNAPLQRLLKPDNRGHTFYDDDTQDRSR